MWENLSPQFYATFWSLSLYDVEVPVDRYKAEITKLRDSLKALSDDIARDPAAATVQVGVISLHLCGIDGISNLLNV